MRVFTASLLILSTTFASLQGEDAFVPPPLELKYLGEQGEESSLISWSDIMELPTHTAALSIELDPVERNMTFVYLEDFVKRFASENEADMWLATCSDGYQSNFQPKLFFTAKPYLILKVDEQPLAEWLAGLGHPEWGPYIINTEDDSSLRDPGHKKPWGVESITATRMEFLLQSLPPSFSEAQHELGLDIYINACVSCHDTKGSPLGGTLSTREIALLGNFAKYADPYFKLMLTDAAGTNPLAKKMPSYAHYSAEEYQAIKALLASLVVE